MLVRLDRAMLPAHVPRFSFLFPHVPFQTFENPVLVGFEYSSPIVVHLAIIHTPHYELDRVLL